MRRFLIVIEKASHNFPAYSPDLPGCVATGKTREQAARNMHEAIELHVRGLLEDKQATWPSRLAKRLKRHVGSDSDEKHRAIQIKVAGAVAPAAECLGQARRRLSRRCAFIQPGRQH